MAGGGRVVVEEGRFELDGHRSCLRVVGGGYWTLDAGDVPRGIGLSKVRVEGTREGFSNLVVEKVVRLSDGKVIVDMAAVQFAFEAVLVGGMVLAGFAIAIVDSLDRLVN